jgi:hypothetical protein
VHFFTIISADFAGESHQVVKIAVTYWPLFILRGIIYVLQIFYSMFSTRVFFPSKTAPQLGASVGQLDTAAASQAVEQLATPAAGQSVPSQPRVIIVGPQPIYITHNTIQGR